MCTGSRKVQQVTVGEGVSVAGYSMLKLFVGVGVGWFERNNKASSGLQKQKYESWRKMKYGFFWGVFGYKI